MKPFPEPFQRFLKSDWFVSLLLLVIFLLTNGYIYGWDDQHVEIPLLKHLIDPTLYRGDYYVESLARNFPTYLYPILAHLIKVSQVPAAYLILYLVSRYVLFFWVYRLWTMISGRKLTGFLCTVMFMEIGRTEEFLYRTFSHQEFTLAIMMAGFYFFYRGRFLVAALIYGLGANFHFLYCLFPMFYLSVYVAFFHRGERFKLFLKTGAAFVLAALPFFCWEIPKSIHTRFMIDPQIYKDWVSVFLVACPQNFLFQDTPLPAVLHDGKLLLTKCEPYLQLVVLYLLNHFFHPRFRKDTKAQALSAGAMFLLIVSFVFTYVAPSRFVLDLNLIRNEQFWRFLLMGYTTIFVAETVQNRGIGWAFLAAVLLCFQIGEGLLTLAVTSFITLLFFLGQAPVYIRERKISPFVPAVFVAVLAAASWMAFDVHAFNAVRFQRLAILLGGITMNLVVWIWLHRRPGADLWLRRCFVFIPLLVMIGYFCYFHVTYLKITRSGTGFWQLQRNWEDMQRYVRDHTAKSAYLMVPYNMEMGGFRIQSERKILVCYRDCGIVGFDYPATLEWQRRVADIEPFKVFTSGPITKAVINAIVKYRVNYIVFMRYNAPADNQIVRRIYQNDVFALYKVLINPEI